MTEINNIEEVKKILKARYDENRLCEDFLNSVARQICQLFPQPLPDDISNLISGSGAIITQHIYHISGSQLSELITKWKGAGKEGK